MSGRFCHTRSIHFPHGPGGGGGDGDRLRPVCHAGHAHLPGLCRGAPAAGSTRPDRGRPGAGRRPRHAG